MPWYHLYTDESGISNRYLIIERISFTPRLEACCGLIRGRMSFPDFRYRIYCDKISGIKEEKQFEKLRFFINKNPGYQYGIDPVTSLL